MAAGGVALALCAWPAAAVEPPPRVEIEFLIEEDSQLDQNLTTAGAGEQVRSEVGAELFALVATHFSFLDWQLAGGTSAGPAAIARLSATLQDENRSAGTANVLKFTGMIEGHEVDMEQVPEIEVYSEFVLDKHDAGKIQERILDELEEQMAAFKDPLHQEFVRKIPLSREAFGDAEKERVYIPLDWERLQAASDTVLYVEFEIPSGEEEGQKGILRISSVKERTAGPIPGCVEGAVWFYDLAPTLIPGPGVWPTNISQELNAASERRVLMERYLKDSDAGSSGGLVTTPD